MTLAQDAEDFRTMSDGTYKALANGLITADEALHVTRRERRAERIAADALKEFTVRDGDVEECSAGYIGDVIYAAALKAMTGMEQS